MDGRRGYAWLLANDIFRIFLFRETRSSQVPLEIFGNEDLDLILVTDRYCGYNPLKVKHQYCYVHLIRDLKKLALEFQEDPEIDLFYSDLMPLLKKTVSLKRSRTPPEQYSICAEELKSEIMTICQQTANHPGIQKFQNIFRENEDRLFQWVDHPNVPCENNYAERNLRPIVISRKLSFGCQSERGMKTREIIMSVLHTASSRGIDVQLFLEAILNAICRKAHNDIVRIFTNFPRHKSPASA
jgi:transposase